MQSAFSMEPAVAAKIAPATRGRIPGRKYSGRYACGHCTLFVGQTRLHTFAAVVEFH